MNYTRSLIPTLEKWLYKGKVLTITGARQVGKTTLLHDLFGHRANTLWLNADEQPVRERLATQDLSVLEQVVGHYDMVIIDEVQRVTNAGLLLKLLVDNFKKVQFIATGSSALEISDTIFEPLTGRQIHFHLYPLSIAELYPNKSPFEIEKELHFHLVYGNYPELCVHRDVADPLLQNLTDQYLYKDVLIWKDIRKPELLDKLLRLLAYQIGSEVSTHELATQLGVKSETVESYIELLEKSYVIFRLHAYSSNPRKEVSKMSKIYFWDNGVRNAVINDLNDLTQRNDHGMLFENFVISERLKRNDYAQLRQKPFFWRNYNQSEVDYVELDKKALSGYEIKWNMKKKHRITKAFTNLYPDAHTAVITPMNFVDFVR